MTQSKYLACIEYDEQEYPFLVPKFILKDKTIESFDSKILFGEKAFKILHDQNVVNFDYEALYTFEVVDKFLQEGDNTVFDDNYKNGDRHSKYYGKLLRIQKNRRNDRAINLTTFYEDDTYYEIFEVDERINIFDISEHLDKFKLIHAPITRYIYLTDNKRLAGPFFIENSNIKTTNENIFKLVPYDVKNYEVDLYQNSELKKYYNNIQIAQENYLLIHRDFLDEGSEIKSDSVLDCIPKKELIKVFDKEYEDNPLKLGFEPTENRKKRIAELKEQKYNYEEYIDSIKENFINDNNFIQSIIKSNSDLLDEISNKEIEKLSQKLSVAQLNLKEKEEQIKEKEEQIKEKEEQIESLEEQLNSPVNFNKQRIEELVQKEKELADYNSLKESSDNLKDEVKYAERRQKDLVKEISTLENQKDSIIKAFEDSLNEKYSEIQGSTKSIVDSYVGADFLSRILKKVATNDCSKEYNDIIPMQFKEDVNKYKKYDNPQEFIDDIHDFFKNNNRNFKKNDIANILVCFAQGFLTIFAGEPGTGKTSFVKLLAQALGLVNDEQAKNRYTEISVEKGWTSKRDFIGYYNPLTKEINCSNKDLYYGLKQLNKEADEKVFDFPYIVLLDEANLSPMEYYWADFMKICDYKEDNCKINLFENYNLTIPKTLRFFATINLDHTTEILSPRLIDRSWIIKLPYEQKIDLEYKFNSLLSMENKPTIKNNILDKINNVDINKTPLPKSVLNKFNNFRNEFADNGIYLSPRIVYMIKKYCVAIEELKLMEKNNNDLVALDYAISQKLLPMINGQGEKYAKFIDKLIDLTEGMENCKNILTNIKNNAENNGMEYYHYFAR